MTSLEKAAIAKARQLGAGPAWLPFNFVARDGYVEVTGADARTKTRGKWKGEPTWRGADPKSFKTVAVTERDMAEAERAA